MPRSSYRERDSAFGQRLQVSPRAVGEWEAGSSSPKAERLKEYIAVSGAAAPRLWAPVSGPLLDWGDALSVPGFYGRAEHQSRAERRSRQVTCILERDLC
jgi:hypothetical protein